ncbi:MAG: succinate dehydrogenase assembly factor 2 [Rubrivivax sp.]
MLEHAPPDGTGASAGRSSHGDAPQVAPALLDPQAYSRLRWRCRRGMLENDLFVERFLNAHDGSMTHDQAQGLQALMALADNDLLDLLLARREPEGDLDRAEVRDVLVSMRALRAAPAA